MTRIKRMTRMKFSQGLLYVFSLAATVASAAEPVTLTFDQAQTAGISGLRRMWDQPIVLDETGLTPEVVKHIFGTGPSARWLPDAQGKPQSRGALVFDAVHRSLLVRFPGIAQAIAAKLEEGYRLDKAELVMTFRDTEYWPEGYLDPDGMSFLGTLWVDLPPRWHAVAHLLRRPWVADEQLGPTYNAAINGAVYWAKFGAQDEQADRYPQSFGPTPVSLYDATGLVDVYRVDGTLPPAAAVAAAQSKPLDQRTPARMDVTAAFADQAIGKTVGDRLRQVEECGFAVQKWENYDVRYWRGVYEFGTSTGGRGILVTQPRLVVTFVKVPEATTVKLPKPVEIEALAKRMAGSKRGGQPTAVMPTAEQITAWAAEFNHKPQWMSQGTWQRVQELYRVDHRSLGFPATPELYAQWIDAQLAIQPRMFRGWSTTEMLPTALTYGRSWPAPVMENHRRFWEAWVLPERPTDQIVHPQAEIWKNENCQGFYIRTGDWRGNSSFFRGGYCYAMSTMNFNHTAASGALLGGYLADSPLAIADGRHGLEHFPLRLWSWYDGSTQESIDHYYFAMTLRGQKLFADFGPTVLDRLMGQSILAKSVDELASSWHPQLRRFIATSGRTSVKHLIVTQDGLCHIMHTLSPQRGALHDVDNAQVPENVPLFGHEAPPGTIAEQTLQGPWAEPWMANLVESKPLPYELTVGYKQWGGFGATPLHKRSYLGHHYGVASLDVSIKNETVPAMVQWRRISEPAQTFDQVGTLIMRYGWNDTNLIFDNANGSVGTQGGTSAALQHKNKLIFLTSPVDKLNYPGTPIPTEIRSLQTTLGLFNDQKPAQWEIYVDQERVSALPVTAKFGQRITIKDGPAFVAIIPLGATDLGRDAEVVLKAGQPQPVGPGMGTLNPALLIESYNFRSATPLDQEHADWAKINAAYNGFVIEVSDVTEYADFAAFQKHVREAKLKTRFEDDQQVWHVDYTSGTDQLECGYRTTYAGDWNQSPPTDQCFPYRRVNGAWPYLPKGVDRDSTMSQQGTTGRLEKNGAVLVTDPGKMAYLVTEPQSGNYCAWNPLPEPMDLMLTVPGGMTIQAVGKLGIARVVAEPEQNRLSIDYASNVATALHVTGVKNPPEVVLNGQSIKPRREADRFVIPLPVTP